MNKVLKDTKPLMIERFGKAISDTALSEATARLKALCEENKGDDKARRAHTFKKIYPCIAMYEGLQKAGVSKEDAKAFLDFSHSKLAEPKAKAMQMMCKLPGMYKKMPKIFENVTKSQFGIKQGFSYKFYDTKSTRCKFDMTKCVYAEVLTKYGYPELIVCFCHTDDVTDGNIHPKLKWNRTKTIGDGADVCDFDLYIMDENGEYIDK